MELWKNNVWVPVVVIVVLLGILFAKGTVLDFVADRVIDRMESKYSPYGPQAPQVAPHAEATSNEAGSKYVWYNWTTKSQ